jgi:Bacterial pre-peptidase C-terminal domain
MNGSIHRRRFLRHLLILSLFSILFFGVIGGVSAAPGNDFIGSAAVFANTTSRWTNTQSISGATVSGTDPVMNCGGVGRFYSQTVWWRYTAPIGGQVTIDTLGSNYDTVLAVYTGGLSQLACNDDTGGLQSQLNLFTTAGGTYYIMIARYGTTPSNINVSLRLRIVGNDFITNSRLIPGGIGLFTVPPEWIYFAPYGATWSPSDPLMNCGGVGGNYAHTVWFRYIPSLSRTVTINTVGSNYDTVLAVYSNGAQRACNDDISASNLQSQASLFMTAGTPYYIMVAKYSTAQLTVNRFLNLRIFR